jgi:hypothetical protein
LVEIRSITASSVSYRQVNGSTSLLYVFVVVKFRLPRLKYLLGGTQRILVQMFDVHSFSEISDTHKYAKSLVRKTDGMGNVVAFPTLEFLQFGKEASQVLRRAAAKVLGLLVRAWARPAVQFMARTWAKWARSHFGQCPVQMLFCANVCFITF